MYLQIFVIFVLLAAALHLFSRTATGRNTQEDTILDRIQNQFSQQQCWKEIKCKPNGKTVCAFNQKTGKFVDFNDKCAVIKANCRKEGMYMATNMRVCNSAQNDLHKVHEQAGKILNHATPLPIEIQKLFGYIK